MGDESKTADGRRRWQHWTEDQAGAAMEELAQSGVSRSEVRHHQLDRKHE
jgi:hypothetical protein